MPIKNLTGVFETIMNQTLENKLSMYLAVQKVCADNNSIWSGIVACATAITDLQNKVNQIVTVRQIQESNPTGITQDKAVRKEIMVNQAMFVKGAVQAYATNNGNNELFESVNYSVSEMKRPADTICRDRALLIYNKANDIVASLSTYGVDATVLSNLQTAINDYAAIIARPRTAKSSIKAATTALNQLFVDTDLIIKRKIDLLMVQFKATNTSFYNTYLNARIIIDLGKGSKTIEVILNALEMKTVQRVINDTILANTGTTKLRYCADHLPPCDAGDESAIIMLPGDSIKIDIKESFITITNIDETLKGSFKVKVTSEVPVVS